MGELNLVELHELKLAGEKVGDLAKSVGMTPQALVGAWRAAGLMAKKDEGRVEEVAPVAIPVPASEQVEAPVAIVVEQPVSEPVVEQPASEPAVEQPVVETVVEAPVVEQPVAQEPVEPVSQEPVVEQPQPDAQPIAEPVAEEVPQPDARPASRPAPAKKSKKKGTLARITLRVGKEQIDALGKLWAEGTSIVELAPKAGELHPDLAETHRLYWMLRLAGYAGSYSPPKSTKK